MIEMRHLKAVAALAETGSITRAAARLHLSQSALSHQLADLEAGLGVKLVERGQRPLRLTAAGERLLLLARHVLPEWEAARRDLAALREGAARRELRIAVECHTCYDWLMPAMDAYRAAHPEVEQDLVPGFHTEAASLLLGRRADLVIVSEAPPRRGVAYLPLFSYEIVALVANDHPLARRARLSARDFAGDTLITYPVPDRMLDLVRRVLKPAGVDPPRRTAELTVAILQLVASRRGIAALPRWAVESYLARDYVTARRIGPRGLWGRLWAAVRAGDAAQYGPFAELLRQTAMHTLRAIRPLP